MRCAHCVAHKLITFMAAKFKPRHCRLELEGGTTVPKLSSSTVTPSTCLAVGVVKDNKLNITPLKQVLQLRPPFNNLAARGEVLENADDDTVDVKVKPRLEQVWLLFSFRQTCGHIDFIRCK